MVSDATHRRKPIPSRPKTGWLAWESTTGYIALNYSPDATLKIEIYPVNEVVSWAATFSWGQHQESVRDRFSLGEALGALWLQIEAYHPSLMEAPEAKTRRPISYGDDEWLDQATLDVFSRLVGVTEMAFGGQWQLVVVYRPEENPPDRVQTRLVAHDGEATIGARGPTLRDACRALFTSAAVRFRQFVLKL
jgi:hypothetical protein